jgi:hypothetical protein
MRYTMEELVRALVVQTMGEVSLDESCLQEELEDSPYRDFAENLFHQLRGVRPGSDQANQVVSKMAAELDRFSHYPASHQLLDTMEDVIWNKYAEDPRPYVRIVVDALGTPAVADWFQNHRLKR